MNASLPALGHDDLHLWAIPVHDPPLPVRRLRAILTDRERERMDRFRSEEDRLRSVVARGMLRVILAGYAGLRPSEIGIRTGPLGKPEAAPGEGAGNLCFNASHSGGWVLLGVTDGTPVGVDVELIREVSGMERIASRWFAEEEAEALLALPVERRTRAFFYSWTLKEACQKALGMGLHTALDQFSFPAHHAKFGPMQEIPGVRCEGSPWSVWTLRLGDAYSAAVAATRPGLRPQPRSWTGSGGILPWPQ